MADIIFPVTTGNALITAVATASTNPVNFIIESATATITAQAGATTDPVFHIAESETAAIIGQAAGNSDPTFYIDGFGTASISGQAAALHQRWIELQGTAQIIASVVYANRYTKSTELILTLQPGESVVIDSEKYTVTKDGESVIGAHTGEWIDALNAETPNIDVKANASTVSAEIVYTPRYL